MRAPTARPVGRRLLPALLAGAVLALLALPSPAAAHDQLIGGSPFEGDVVATAPEELTMEFSSTLLDVGSLVMVVDESGDDWAAGAPQLVGPEVTVPLRPEMPEGVYEVRWQVVSSDGHPLSDIYRFGVGDVEPAALAREPLPSGGDDASAATAEDAPAQQQGVPPVLLAVLIGLGGAVIGAAAFLIVLRSRRTTNTQEHS